MRILYFCIIMSLISNKIESKPQFRQVLNDKLIKSVVNSFYENKRDEINLSFQKYFGIPYRKREIKKKSISTRDVQAGINALQLAIQKSQLQRNNIVNGHAKAAIKTATITPIIINNNNIPAGYKIISPKMALREINYPDKEICDISTEASIFDELGTENYDVEAPVKSCGGHPATKCPSPQKELNIAIAEKLRQEMHQNPVDKETENLPLKRAKCILSGKIKQVQDLNHEILEVQAVATREKERLITLEDFAKKVKCLKTDYAIQLSDLNKHIGTAQKAESYLNKFKKDVQDEIKKVLKIIQSAKTKLAETFKKVHCKQEELQCAKNKAKALSAIADQAVKQLKCG